MGRNDFATMTGVIKNTGDADITYIEIAAELDDGIITVSQTIFYENTLKIGESYTWQWEQCNWSCCWLFASKASYVDDGIAGNKR